MSKLDKRHIKEIKKYFEAPMPQDKDAFLDKINTQAFKIEEPVCRKTSLLYMIFVQFSYISKWLWAFSVLVFLFTFIVSTYLQEILLWPIFAVMPFIVTFSLSESMRSVVYGMGEFEMTSRFSLKSIIMARMLVLGVGNMILLFALAGFKGDSMWRNVAYMLVPYLSSATGGLVILRKFTSKEGVYLSCAFSIIISVLFLAGVQSFNWIYEARYTSLWLIAAIALLINASYECYKTADAIGSSV